MQPTNSLPVYESRHHWLYCAGMTMALLWGFGCSISNAAGRPARPARNKMEDAFQVAIDRPPTAKTLYVVARLLAVRGKDSECQWILKRIITNYPTFMPAYCKLAELHMRSQRIDDAVKVLKLGLSVRQSDSVLLNDLGMCWFIKGEYGQAVQFFTQAAAAMPQNARYRSNMALAYGMMGRYEEALSLFEQVVPTAEAHFNLAVLCEARSDHVRAATEYEEAEALGYPPKDGPGTRR